ncbi:hypothetical protein PFNF135_06329 [Plasmodium falciparum NF135/5.C10]|uniref:Uncharacterized protein n=1 Tax=Plasmodium falciparum NF135/5.C10 TaxID=1036726 RepID=W4I795_PLAFA|nr:hypothetical protein PFNF135_06329 [Plasmodium falciparum NF135/5.C10]
MDMGVEKLLNQLNELESKNRLIHIEIEELKITQNELNKKEKELIVDIENICTNLKLMEKENIQLNNDIDRVNLICKNVETTLHNEFVKINLLAEKIRINKNDPNFNFVTMSNFYGVNEKKEKEKKMENFGLSELNKIMINHYKSKKINVDK